MMIIIIWIGAYTLCLMNVGLLLHRYVSSRDKGILYFLVLVVDMLFVTIVLMILMMFLKNERLFDIVVINGLLSYYVTVPLFAYEASGVRRPKVFVFAVAAVSIVAFNLLAWFGSPSVTFPLYPIPFIFLMVPLPLRRLKNVDETLGDGGFRFRKSIARAGMMLGGITLALGALYFLLVETVLRRGAFLYELIGQVIAHRSTSRPDSCPPLRPGPLPR